MTSFVMINFIERCLFAVHLPLFTYLLIFFLFCVFLFCFWCCHIGSLLFMKICCIMFYIYLNMAINIIIGIIIIITIIYFLRQHQYIISLSISILGYTEWHNYLIISPSILASLKKISSNLHFINFFLTKMSLHHNWIGLEIMKVSIAGQMWN